MFIEKWGLAAGCQDYGLVDSGRSDSREGAEEIAVGRFRSEIVRGKKELKRTWCCACS